MTIFKSYIKRAVDVCVAFFCIILTLPLFIVCYLLIKLEDGGKVIFKQERIGLHGRPFIIYKFRSTRIDLTDEGYHLFNPEKDMDLLTKVGKFIRKSHLDELPQLWNVVKGDMALVGYRPERKFYIDKIMEMDPRYELLYQTRPGITSHAALYNGYTDTMEKMLKRLEMDLYYMEHYSLGADLKILLKTFEKVITNR